MIPLRFNRQDNRILSMNRSQISKSILPDPSMKVFQANDKPGLNAFTLGPMAAGDMIDLAVRIYRRQALPLLQIVLLPSLISYAGMILFSIGLSNFSTMRGDRRVVITSLLILGGAALYLLGKAAFYAVLGGASQSFFHYLLGEDRRGGSAVATQEQIARERPFRVGEVYRAVRQRFGSMIGAMLLLFLIAFCGAVGIYLIFSFALILYITFHISLVSSQPLSIQIISGGVFGLSILGGLTWCGLQLYCRIVYVPQILLVEGQGIIRSIHRSFRLAGGQVRHTGALILFWFYAAWSIWLLLVLPLAWYGYLEGLEINPFNPEGPLWYRISQQTLIQLSEILVAPVAMLGFTLLYLDTRIRKEGLDIELLADRIIPAPVDRSAAARKSDQPVIFDSITRQVEQIRE